MAASRSIQHAAREDGSRRELGRRMRAAREAAGIGLRELARRIGCSPGLISQIEHGKVAPSVPRLYAIARELDVSVDALLEDGRRRPGAAPVPAPAAGERYVHVPAARRRVIELPDGVTWKRLAGAADAVEFREVTYEPGAMSSPPGELLRHQGHEYGYVVEGRFRMQIDADELALVAGDSIALPAQVPHRLWNDGDTPARAVWIIVGEGDHHAQQLPAGESLALG